MHKAVFTLDYVALKGLQSHYHLLFGVKSFNFEVICVYRQDKILLCFDTREVGRNDRSFIGPGHLSNRVIPGVEYVGLFWHRPIQSLTSQ